MRVFKTFTFIVVIDMVGFKSLSFYLSIYTIFSSFSFFFSPLSIGIFYDSIFISTTDLLAIPFYFFYFYLCCRHIYFYSCSKQFLRKKTLSEGKMAFISTQWRVSNALHFFLQMQISTWYHFLSAWRTHFLQGRFVVDKFHEHFYPKSFYFAFILERSFFLSSTESQAVSSSSVITSSTLLHCLPTCVVSDKKSAGIFIHLSICYVR